VDPAATSTPEPPVIRIRVTVRVPDLDTFITRYSRHLAGDRIFIFTKTPQPVGTRVRFSLHLADGEPIIHGKGTVTRVQSGDDARHPPGMELVFVTLDDRSQTIVDFMHAARLGTVENLAPIARAVVPSRPPPLPPAPLPPAPLPPSPSAPSATTAPPPVATPAPTTGAPTERSTAPATPTATTADATPTAQAAMAAGASVPATGESGAPTAAPPPSPSTASAAAPVDVGQLLAEALGPFAARAPEPVVPGPAPAMAEAWRGQLAPGPPAALPAGEVPANPFSDVSDGAIDYFVEWSLEQSIGPRVEPTSTFSNVPMSLPGGATGAVTALADAGDGAAPARPRRRVPGWALALGGFFAGAPAGALVMRLVAAPAPAPALHPATATPVAAAPREAPPPATSDETATTPKPADQGPATTTALSVTTRPPGAEVTIDGKPAGVTPLKTSVTPGKHELTITRDRYDTITQTVEAPGAVTLDLKRPLYTLEITSTPPGAPVTVAGVARGRTPVTVKLPGFERYDVRVTPAGRPPWRRPVYLKDPTTTVDASTPPPTAKRTSKGRPLLAPLGVP
jgi:uncharacterized protein (TIGR02266 family)